jgi:hypothetical protein
MITNNEYKENLHGYQITDCAVRNRNYFHFIVRSIEQSIQASAISEGTVTKREVGFYRDEPLGQRLGAQGFANFERTFVGATLLPNEQVVCIDTGGMVYSRGSGSEDFESPIPKSKEGPRRGAIRRIRMIQGVLYAVGSGHTVCRRRGCNDWESLCLNLPKETLADFESVDRSANMAFEDIDGFSATDLYAIAGKGRIWHFDGKQWAQIAFPSNMQLTAVCCAGDGNVYIGAQAGSIFRGRRNEWKLMHRGDMTLPFQDMVWHAGRVWCTSDYGLWTIDGDQVVKASMPSEIAVCAGNLSAADGVMLMAGAHGAAFHDGHEWQSIFVKQQMES